MEENIYKPPKSGLEDDKKVTVDRFPKKLRGVFLSLFAAWFYFGLNKVVPQFAETFNSFGADLPALTVLSIKCSVAFKWLGIFGLIVFIFWLVCILFSVFEKGLYKIVQINFYFSLSILIVTMISLYLPIFSMGNGV